MKKVIVSVLLISLFIGTATISFGQNKLESWYTYWGLGYADISYPEELENVLNIVKEAPGVSHLSISLDILGFYWPKGEKTIIGAIANGWGDRYEANDENFQINGYLISFSVMHFLNNRIGQGLFLRGDFGPARLSVDSSIGEEATSDWGYGGLIGTGYGISVSPGTRILFNINYSFRQVEGESYGTLGISIGGLF